MGARSDSGWRRARRAASLQLPPAAGASGPAQPERAGAPVAPLSPARRESSIATLESGVLDVLVVGGGVVGVGAALDAASRGLAVGLVETHDIAFGASSASSKLVHGGLRYVQMLDLALVREALAERSLLLGLAPHLVRPVPFLYPLRHRGWERPYVGAGLALYDALALAGSLGRAARAASARTDRPQHGAEPGAAAGGRLPRHRNLSKRRALELVPALRPDAVAGGIEYWDAQVDDARYVVALARTAAGLGAHIVTGAAAVGMLEAGGAGHGAVGGVKVRLENGRELDVRARVVLAATGAWTGALQKLAGLDGSLPLRPSKGVHLVVAGRAIRSNRALVVPTGKSVLFVIPWGDHWLVGTTDTPWDLGPDHPVASRDDVEYLLGEANKILHPPLVEGDVEAVYAGLRPLVAAAGAETTRVSREHAVVRLRPGLYLVTGGKYTTYRLMARDAIDLATEELGRRVGASRTERIPIAGAAGWSQRFSSRHELAARWGLEVATVEHLLGRYGGLVDEVLAEAGPPRAEGPAGLSRLLDPIPGGGGYLAVEARYAVSHEGARHLDDVLSRRTRLSIERSDRGCDAAPAVAAEIAPLLGWDEAQAASELDGYRRAVERAERAERASGDELAHALVSGAPGDARS